MDNAIDEGKVAEESMADRGQRLDDFQKELKILINKFSLESVYSDTPDFVIVSYLMRCLFNLSKTIDERKQYYKNREITNGTNKNTATEGK